jgi:hypothetical protein
VLSKRKLIQLVDEKHVSGWDDPRLPTLVGARRRGYTAEGFQRFTDQIGVSKSDGWIDYSVFEACQRDVLNDTALRRIAVLDPVKLIIDNYPEAQSEDCFAPNHPQQPDLGKRAVPFSKELWIEREDFMETPSKGYFRLFPGNSVRLRYGYVVTCTGCDKDENGTITAVRHPGRRLGQGQGQHPLGVGRACVRSRSAPVRPLVHDRPAGWRKWRFSEGFECRLGARDPRTTGIGFKGRCAGGPLPVRTPRLLRRRPRRFEIGRACVQPHGDAEGFVGEGRKLVRPLNQLAKRVS